MYYLIVRHKGNQEQADLLEHILNVNNKSRPRSDDDKNKQIDVFECAKNLYEGREWVFNAFKSRLFPLKLTNGTGIKILTANKCFKDYQ